MNPFDDLADAIGPRFTEEPIMDYRSSRAALRAEYRCRVFQVFNGDEWMCSYGDMFFMQPDAPSPTRDMASTPPAIARSSCPDMTPAAAE